MLCGMAAATLEEILEAINVYADYDRVGSVEHAEFYLEACRRFLHLPSSSSEQGSSVAYSLQYIQSEIADARAYIAANKQTSSGSSSVRFLSASEGFRR
jgi:hypothetical protein